MDLPAKMREIARQLVDHEAAAVNSKSRTAIPAADVLEALRRPLCTLVGVQGCRVLFTRALTLARAKVPSLSAVTVQPDGSVAGLSNLSSEEVSEAGVVLTAQLLRLLATFIGRELMLRILMGIWPDLTVSDTRGSGQEEL